MATFKMVADVQTADMLNLPVPKANFHTEVIQPNELQRAVVAELAERAERVRARAVDPRTDNMRWTQAGAGYAPYQPAGR